MRIAKKKKEEEEKLDVARAYGATVLIVNMASDEDSDEDFVSYGTPLEPLEEGTNVTCTL